VTDVRHVVVGVDESPAVLVEPEAAPAVEPVGDSGTATPLPSATADEPTPQLTLF